MDEQAPVQGKIQARTISLMASWEFFAFSIGQIVKFKLNI